MGWPEYIIYKFDQIIFAIGSLVYHNLFAVYCLLIITLFAAYIDASSDTFEILAAQFQKREPVLSDPPKQVTLC